MQSTRCMRSRGFSLIELLIVIAIITLILVVAIPNAMNARMNAVETVVMREMQTIQTAQTQYQTQFGEFAASLAELGPPVSGQPGPSAAKLIPAALASGEKDGYLFSSSRTTAGFSINANPRVYGQNGRRTFYLDQDGTIHQNWGPEPASAGSPEMK